MKGCHIAFGKYALQALEPGRIKAKTIEVGRRAISKFARGGGKIWVRMIPDKPVSMKPIETRMGKGKGATAYNVADVKPGRVLYELGGVSEAIARIAIAKAAFKMPTRTRFIRLD